MCAGSSSSPPGEGLPSQGPGTRPAETAQLATVLPALGDLATRQDARDPAEPIQAGLWGEGCWRCFSPSTMPVTLQYP